MNLQTKLSFGFLYLITIFGLIVFISLNIYEGALLILAIIVSVSLLFVNFRNKTIDVADMDKMTDEYYKLSEKIDFNKNELEVLQKEKETKSNELNNSKAEIGAANKKLTEYNNAITSFEKRLKKYKKKKFI